MSKDCVQVSVVYQLIDLVILRLSELVSFIFKARLGRIGRWKVSAVTGGGFVGGGQARAAFRAAPSGSGRQGSGGAAGRSAAAGYG